MCGKSHLQYVERSSTLFTTHTKKKSVVQFSPFLLPLPLVKTLERTHWQQISRKDYGKRRVTATTTLHQTSDVVITHPLFLRATSMWCCRCYYTPVHFFNRTDPLGGEIIIIIIQEADKGMDDDLGEEEDIMLSRHSRNWNPANTHAHLA